MSQISAYTGDNAKDIIIQWVRDNGYTPDDVRIKQRDGTVWAERK